jgi:hypothetical protein
VEFKKRFGGIDELKRQQVEVGGLAVLQREGRFVYYLITKPKYWNKPRFVVYHTFSARCLFF